MLQKHAHFNDLSPKLRKELEDKVKSFGKKLRFKFHISNENPDPLKYNGKTVWPFMYTLDPRTFRIVDAHEERSGVTKSKEIGLVNKIDRDGKPESFHRIRVFEREAGIKEYDLEKPEEFDQVMYLLLHPKLKAGKFQDASKHSVFELIDEKAEAKLRQERREEKRKAINIAGEMNDQKVKEFAKEMEWDTNQDVSILRDQIEAMAETTPDSFISLVQKDKGLVK